MPAKHSTRRFGPARLIFCFAAAILAVLVVWVAIRAVGPAEASRQPTVVLPSMPRVAMASPSPSVSTTRASSPSVSPSRSPSPAPPSPSASAASPSVSAPSVSPSARPATSSATPRVSPTTTKPVVVVNDLAASLTVTASWNAGYVAVVRVENTGGTPRAWTVTVAHQGQDGLRLAAVWGARGTQEGAGLIFTGGPLAAGSSATFGYQTTKNSSADARPAGCTVVGGTCTVR